MRVTKRWFCIIFICLVLVSACGKSEAEITAEEKPENVNAPVKEAPQVDTKPAEEGEEPEFFPWACDDFSVEAGKELGFFYEWTSKTEEQNNEYFKVAEHRITINGVPIDAILEGVGDIEYDKEGNSRQLYWVVVGDFPPGTYEIVNTIEITKPVYDGWDWYGPDSENPSLESGCTMTVGDAGDGPQAGPEDLPLSPAKVCQIESDVKEDWDIALCETFDADTTLWTGNQEGTSARIEGGQYILDNSTKVKQGYKTGFIFPVNVGSSKDHMISVDGTMESNYQGCTWGVFIRSESNEIVYFFMINNSGQYTLTGSSDRESARYLGNIDSGSNGAIVWDGTNTITAAADGKQMEFYVNGELIITHEAINSENPYFGLIVWGGEGVTAINRFDNLLVRTK
ncbi:MAG: hypothetical protein J7L66_03385 [Anaerolineaceae bacterium]|nr:hypothetical protein [Anaerolineaceae bacterium]